MTSGQIQVAQYHGVEIVRLIGDVRLNLCIAFDRYIRQVLSDGMFANVLIENTIAGNPCSLLPGKSPVSFT